MEMTETRALTAAPSTGASATRAVAAPPLLPVVGVPISATDYDAVIAFVLDSARRAVPCLVTALAVHGVIEARSNPEMTRAIRAFDIVTPDGQPVRIALNQLWRAGLKDRVYGPTLMLRLCESAAVEELPVFLYGSTPAVVRDLAAALSRRYPALQVVGAEPSVFRPLSVAESRELAERIRARGARLVFVGLGCPRQEIFAAAHRDLVGLPMICVGAAFDFHAGTKRQAPQWMQDHALEWLFRLGQEPRRLFRRYAVTNTRFVLALARQLVFHTRS